MNTIEADGKKALCVVDVQNYFITDETAHLPQAIRNYVENNRDTFAFIIFTKFINNESSSVFRILKWEKCMVPPETDFAPELEPVLGYGIVVEKNGVYSALKAPEVQTLLQEHKINTLVLCGMDTDCCVLFTAADAFDQGFTVVLLEDLSMSHAGRAFHDRAVTIFRRDFGNVASSV